MSKDAIANAHQVERDELIAQCQRLLLKVSYRPGAIKLLTLAKEHLTVLSNYKLGRSRDRTANKID
jgi:hypothetical protein